MLQLLSNLILNLNGYTFDLNIFGMQFCSMNGILFDILSKQNFFAWANPFI